MTSREKMKKLCHQAPGGYASIRESFGPLADRVEVCHDCSGTGTVNLTISTPRIVECTICDGAGFIYLKEKDHTDV